MDNWFFIAGIIAFIFLLVKFMELRFVENEQQKALKFLIRDTLIVYCCVIAGFYLYDQFRPVTKNTGFPVFTGSPDF